MSTCAHSDDQIGDLTNRANWAADKGSEPELVRCGSGLHDVGCRVEYQSLQRQYTGLYPGSPCMAPGASSLQIDVAALTLVS